MTKIDNHRMFIRSYIEKCSSYESKNFTKILKRLEKQFGYFPDVNFQNALMVLDECKLLFKEGDSNALYNCLRLLKYVVTNNKLVKVHHTDIWDVYKKTILHPNGNIRNAGIFLLDRFRFALTSLVSPFSLRQKATQREVNTLEKFDIACWQELQDLEVKYIRDHNEALISDDKGDASGMPFSTETKDIFLKSIRRGLEKYPMAPYFENMLDRHGYKPSRYNGIEKQDQHPLSSIKLKYFSSKPAPEVSLPPPFICHQCNLIKHKVGVVQNAYTEKPLLVCEDCAITNFQADYGFTNREAAIVRRRRMFDVSYLFVELFIDSFMKSKDIKDIEELDENMYQFVTEDARQLYNFSFSREQKIRLEETKDQADIEKAFGRIIKEIKF